MEREGANWTCPFCGRHTTITSPNYHRDSNRVLVSDSALASDLALTHIAIVCPNPDCRQLTFHVTLSEASPRSHNFKVGSKLQSWQLLPESSAKPQPEYIPKSLRDDYLEAKSFGYAISSLFAGNDQKFLGDS